MPRKRSLHTLIAAFAVTSVLAGAAIAYDPYAHGIQSGDPYGMNGQSRTQPDFSNQWYDVDPQGRPLQDSSSHGSATNDRSTPGKDCQNTSRELRETRSRLMELAKRYAQCLSTNSPREDCSAEFAALQRLHLDQEDTVARYARVCTR